MKRLAGSLFTLVLAASLLGCGRNSVSAADGQGGTGKLMVTVQDSQGPVPGANVEVATSAGTPAGTGVQSDDKGVAEFDNLPAGDGYAVTAEHSGATGHANVSIGAGRTETVTLNLQVGSGPGGLIAGTVKIANTDRALPGAKIEVVGTSLSAIADDTGHYKLDNVPAGQQQIKASYSGFYDAVRDLAVKAGTSNSLVIELSPQSAGMRAQHTVITTPDRIVEVDPYHNPLSTTHASQAWSAIVNRSTGNTLIADAARNAAVETTDKGTTLHTFSGSAWWKLGLGGVKAPHGATYTPSGTILVADTGHNQVVELDSSDHKVWTSKISLSEPRWAERERTGTTLIADTGDNRVVEVDSSGNAVWGVGDGSTNIVNHPTYAQRLPSGNTLVTDAGNNRVMEINPQGMLVWMVGGNRPVADGSNLSNPNCAVRLPSGNTLIADTGNNRVIEVDNGNTVVWQMPAPQPLFVDRL